MLSRHLRSPHVQGQLQRFSRFLKRSLDEIGDHPKASMVAPPNAINMALWAMRTTVEIPDGMYRQLKSRAAREGTSTRALILRGVKNVLNGERRKAGAPVSLPIVRSKRPGTVALDNAAIYDVAFP